MSSKIHFRKQFLALREKFNQNSYFKKELIIYQKVKNILDNLYDVFRLKPFTNSYDVQIVNPKTEERNNQSNYSFGLGIYYPLKLEPDLFKLSIKSKWIICLPKIINKEMEYVRYVFGNKLLKRGNIHEPSSNLVILPRVVIIPGLAFDLRGYRLGYGTGSYDRYFAKHDTKGIIKIGVCYDEMLKEKIPTDVYDIKMDYLVTDINTYKLQK